MEIIPTRYLLKNVQMTGAVVLIGVFLITIQIGSSQARSLDTNDDFFSDPIMKRNTWWSKKSLNALDTVQQNDIQADITRSGKCHEALEVYDCYIAKCVQSFVTCAREAGTEELFGACQVLHKLCASSCSRNNYDGTLSL